MALTLAAAQSLSIARDIDANIAVHLQFMALAARKGVQLLVFSELSLTGYELDAAAQLAIKLDDLRLVPLRKMAKNNAMTAVIGMPIRLTGGPETLIGALIFHPDGTQSLYSKQHLHPGEESVITVGTGGEALAIDNRAIAFAICADAMHSGHRANACKAGADIYAAGVLISPASYAAESQQLADYAKTDRMMVLLANHGGASGGWECAGRSAIWSSNGELISAAKGQGPCLVIAQENELGEWTGKVINVELEI